MRRLPLRTAVLALALTAACGPHIPLNLAVQEVPLGILLGSQGSKAGGSILHYVLPELTFPELLPPGSAPEPLLPATPCPSAPPGTDPLVPASPDLLGEPKPGVYPVRISGAFQPDVTKPKAQIFPIAGTMTVSPPAAALPGSSSDYTYSVTESVGGPDGTQSEQITFLVVPSNPTESAPAGQVVTQAAGVFISKIVWAGPQGTTTFSPTSPITYLNLPAALASDSVLPSDPTNPTGSQPYARYRWSSSGTDPVSHITMQLTGAIEPSPATQGTGRYRVDACGQVYDSWEVHATGTLVTPTQNLSLDWHYDIATQFGGLELRHTLTETGTFDGATGPTGLSAGTVVIDTITPEKARTP